MNRYARQTRLAGFDSQGQRALASSRVAIVGCGALGSAAANVLTRAGVGTLDLIDRDVVELSNLHRQNLYTEADAQAGLPKAAAAAEHLAAINSDVQLRVHVADLVPDNAVSLLEDADVIIDGLDSFGARLLVNDVAVKHNQPYVYGGAVAGTGVVMPIITAADKPIRTACLRCLIGEGPSPGASPTCDTVGVFPSLPTLVATVQVAEAINLLLGRFDAVNTRLQHFELWAAGHRSTRELDVVPDPGCPCCSERRFDYLAGVLGSTAQILCGQDSVQIAAPNSQAGADPGWLKALADQLDDRLPVTVTPWMLSIQLQHGGRDCRVSLFADGRAIVAGTSEPELARAVYARIVGH